MVVAGASMFLYAREAAKSGKRLDGGARSRSCSLIARTMASPAGPSDAEDAKAAAKAQIVELRDLEQANVISMREEKRAKAEIKELETAAKEHNEQLTSLRERVAAVTSELSQLKMNSTVTQALIDDNDGIDTDADPNFQIVTFREASGTISKAFSGALKAKLYDPEFVDSMGEETTESQAEFCHVILGEGDEAESADFKVHDPRDATEMTFGSLLQDVCRYWGLDRGEMYLADQKGAKWPLELYVWDELGPTGDVTVWIARRPSARTLDEVEYSYEEDESTLPLAVRRKLDRERRAKQLERHTKESMRKARERERMAVCRELIKYLFMMVSTVKSQ